MIDAFLAQKWFNVPLAIHPAKAEMLVASLSKHLGIPKINGIGGFMADDMLTIHAARDEKLDVVDHIAVIPVYGTLVQKLGSRVPVFGFTGYDGIRANFLSALSDPNVQGIALSIDSGGGDVAGCFDLVDTIYNSRGVKPIWAILSECAYSAAYAIASAADVITVPRTGGTGSVGVISMHCDLSKAYDAAGMKITVVTFGDRKAEGSEFEPLSDTALAKLQDDVDSMGNLFAETVARNRGISKETVISTQATTYLGQQGVNIGFADSVMAPDESFAVLKFGVQDK